MIRLIIINCDNKEVEYNFSNVEDFLNKIDSDIISIPMLDDMIKELHIDNKSISLENLKIVDDLYNLLIK